MPLSDNRNTMQFDIHNLVRFSNNSWLMVKVGAFVYRNTHDHGLFINEEVINWPVNFKKV